MFLIEVRQTPRSTLFPYTTLFRSSRCTRRVISISWYSLPSCFSQRSEEHTSELQSQSKLVCRLLLEKKNIPGCADTAPHYIYNICYVNLNAPSYSSHNRYRLREIS